MKMLIEVLEARVPLFEFGSPDLDMLHRGTKEPAYPVGTRGDGWRLISDTRGACWEPMRTYVVWRQEYGWSHHGFQYVVDHGGFYTLQTIFAGQVVPASEDVKIGEVTKGLRHLVVEARKRAAIEVAHFHELLGRRS